MKLWIFGSSMCLPYKLHESEGWPFLLATHLCCDYVNFAEEACDNFFIYHSFLENYKKIDEKDLVIIGWSHPSRKSFVYNPKNPKHVSVVANGIMYQKQATTLFRSVHKVHGDWQNLKPKNSNVEFYDTYFNNYYSDYEQRCNFQSYLDSVRLRNVAKYLPFYFSKESVDQIEYHNNNFQLEFIIDNQVSISKIDLHMNATGHRLWADQLINQIENNELQQNIKI